MTSKLLSIMLMAVMLVASFAVPLTLAEESEISDAGAGDDSNGEDSVIAPVDASAETEADLEMDESAGAGKVAWKQLRLWLTFKQEKKAKLELEIARLRLIQAKIAARNNDSEAMEKALEAHEKIMNRVQTRMNKMDFSADGDVSAPAEKLVGLERAIQVHERRIAFLNAVLANANLTDAQRAKIEAKIEKVEGVTDKLQELNTARKEKLVTKLMAVGNMTEDEANTLMSETSTSLRERIRERIKAKANSAGDSEDDEDASDADANEDASGESESGEASE